MDSLKKQDFNVVICWIAGHMGFAGYGQADKAAKETLWLDECKISYFKSILTLTNANY